ncbi:amidohydrolase family protein [Halocatena marina]|uniref:amidohydrolase family protein n=1 Tax=Halocatena marina TaxID=2934937 RepID=UPI003614C280
MARYLVTDAVRLNGDRIDVAIENGRIASVRPAGTADTSAYAADRRHDAGGRLVTPSLTEPHIHLDATLTAGTPSWNESGTLSEGIAVWADRKESLTIDGVKARAERTVEWLASHGITRVRTHADTTEETLTGVEALLELREEVSDVVDLQVVAFPQDGLLTREEHEDLFRDAVEMGVDVIGAIPHNEYTREDGVTSVEIAVEAAERYDLPLDLHIDETDDPQSRFTEVLAARHSSATSVTERPPVMRRLCTRTRTRTPTNSSRCWPRAV